MDSGTAGEMIRNMPVACERCNSLKILVFFERKIDKCFATACMDCHHFQIYGASKEQILSWFKNHNIS